MIVTNTISNDVTRIYTNPVVENGINYSKRHNNTIIN